jgi:cytochrome c biogenesis protein CcmG/thiol:disulfide interchange protein DsbE
VTAPAQDEAPAPRRSRALVLVPLMVFGALALLFFVRLFAGDPSRLPSALIGKPVPTFDLPPLQGLQRDGTPVPGLATADLKGGKVHVVNVWASWCVPCRDEHPLLVELAKDPRIALVGINYKDQSENARRFLGALGNPFARVGEDSNGRVGIDWGVYGVPETFVVAPDGTIAYKHVGPLSDDAIKGPISQAIDRAGKKAGS